MLFNHYRLITQFVFSAALIVFTSFASLSLDSGEGSGYTVFASSPTVEEYVRVYFREDPVLAEVAACESQFRQFNSSGDIIRGEVNGKDVGVMQINEDFHLKTADKLGHNLYSLKGNLDYAQYLFDKEGTAPWLASSPCWGVENHIAMK